MTLSMPTRRNSVPARGDRGQLVLSVEFTSSDGRTWEAIGGGDSLAGALAFARESCPADVSWQPVRWSHLYGR